MTVGELGSLAEHTVKAVSKSENNLAINDVTFTNLKESTALFRQAIARKKRSKLAKPFAEASKDRMQSYTGLKMQVKSLKMSKESNTSLQAEQLLKVMRFMARE